MMRTYNKIFNLVTGEIRDAKDYVRFNKNTKNNRVKIRVMRFWQKYSTLKVISLFYKTYDESYLRSRLSYVKQVIAMTNNGQISGITISKQSSKVPMSFRKVGKGAPYRQSDRTSPANSRASTRMRPNSDAVRSWRTTTIQHQEDSRYHHARFL